MWSGLQAVLCKLVLLVWQCRREVLMAVSAYGAGMGDVALAFMMFHVMCSSLRWPVWCSIWFMMHEIIDLDMLVLLSLRLETWDLRLETWDAECKQTCGKQMQCEQSQWKTLCNCFVVFFLHRAATVVARDNSLVWCSLCSICLCKWCVGHAVDCLEIAGLIVRCLLNTCCRWLSVHGYV